MAAKRSARGNGGIGQYVLGKTIGEGTFGKVKLGTHILTGATVAVKILERKRIKEIADVERVAREIHILKRVRHPHIIQLFEIIETPDQLFLIMEFCSGGELFDHIVECGRVPESDACRFFQQILSGVEQVHRINVVHRDLKPENLLLDDDKNIKIVDFGLSNIYKDDQLLKTACGSPCYASPEMIAGHWYVPSRCDVWSCGVILFALVCGYLPFEDGNTSTLYRKILHADYKTPKFITESVRGLIGKMITVDPEKRITVLEIRAHEWYLQVPDSAAIWEEEEIQEDVLKELVEMDFPRDFVVQSLKNRKHNLVTTSYYLLLERNRRIAEGKPLPGDDGEDNDPDKLDEESGDGQAAKEGASTNGAHKKDAAPNGDGATNGAVNGGKKQRNRGKGRGKGRGKNNCQEAGYPKGGKGAPAVATS